MGPNELLQCAPGRVWAIAAGWRRAQGGLMEALVILVVPLIALLIYIISRFDTYGTPRNAQEELVELQQRLAWHEGRLEHARAKNWDRDMIHQITEQLDDTRFQLVQVTARAGK
jgi:hypothetical protein